ncbi:hypothetical protein U8527_08660 [Kordia algicida OT-1]|uniref:Uncharacterized protein n=1 Tax=Kordia algicida OT-1 TaxID=391587 RepID=A9E6U0_9FLAO|nr:hypothetical protein [Kordia algicida]EDP95086.1 hypothetical protein KAOT1_02084 [Kordia algicida OT-1]
MRNVKLIVLLFSSILCFAQNEKKETAYLLFDIKSKKKHLVEDGSGNSKMLNAYRKEKQENLTIMHIYGESFAFGINKQVDTCKIETLNDLKIVDIAYIKDKKSKNVMRYNPFKKIYLIEKISKDKFVKYDVLWIDDWTMIRD